VRYCDPCREREGWPECGSRPQRDVCEVCGEDTVCNDSGLIHPSLPQGRASRIAVLEMKLGQVKTLLHDIGELYGGLEKSPYLLRWTLSSVTQIQAKLIGELKGTQWRNSELPLVLPVLPPSDENPLLYHESNTAYSKRDNRFLPSTKSHGIRSLNYNSSGNALDVKTFCGLEFEFDARGAGWEVGIPQCLDCYVQLGKDLRQTVWDRL